ncbi:MAG: MMPL family transporter [Angelakisella sp.]
MLKKIAQFISYHPKAVLLTAVLLLIPSVFGAVSTRVNYDILSYLPQDLDSSQGTRVLEDTFHSAASTMLIVEGMPDEYTDNLRNRIAEIDGVSNVVWMPDISIPKEILPDEIKDLMYSKTADSTMMLIQYSHSGASDETRAAIAQIYSLCNKQCFLAGVSVITDDIAKLVESEMPVYVLVAVVLSFAAMFFAIDYWLLPVVFMLGIGIAVLYNMGTNLFLGEISYITKAIAAILQLGVSMDYSIFLVNRFMEEKERCADKREAMTNAITGAFISLSGSSLTTIMGFLVLCFMRLTLGKDIGLVMAKGVAIGVLCVVLILPAMILLLDKPINRYRHRTLLPPFTALNRFSIRHSRTLVVLFLVMFLPAVLMQRNVKMYYDLTRALPSELPSMVATNKMKEQYNMATTHFIIVDDSIPSATLEAMEKQIEKLDGVEAVIAYDKVLGSAIPDEFIPDSIKDLCKTDGRQMIMINSRYKAAEDAGNAQIAQLIDIVKAVDPTALVTGEGPMTKDLIETASVDFTVTNYISIAAILLIVGILFRSVTVPIILVASIELAIFLNMSCSYLTGTVIPFISPTVISCIQLGATVDYAILMTTRFEEELQKGLNRKDAILVASGTSTHSIITSSLVLFCATFGVGMISDIEIISSLCTMLARGSIISAAVSLFILPAVLYTFEPLIARTTGKWPKAATAASAATPAPDTLLKLGKD